MIDCFHYQNRQKRGGGRVKNESSLAKRNGDATERPLTQLVVDPASPTSEVAWEERYEQLLRKLNSATLREIAILKIDGYTNEEIAAETNCSRATVCRKLSAIRRIWHTDFEQQLSAPVRNNRKKRPKLAG